MQRGTEVPERLKVQMGNAQPHNVVEIHRCDEVASAMTSMSFSDPLLPTQALWDDCSGTRSLTAGAVQSFRCLLERQSGLEPAEPISAQADMILLFMSMQNPRILLQSGGRSVLAWFGVGGGGVGFAPGSVGLCVVASARKMC